METRREDETRLLSAMVSTGVALETWRTLVTAPPGLRRKRVLERMGTLGTRLGGQYASKTPRLQEKPPHLKPAERVLSAATGVMALGTLLHAWLALVPGRAERQQKLREWSEQRARYRRLRYGWKREGFVGRMRLLAHLVRLPRVATSGRWHAFSVCAAAAHGMIFYYTETPQSSSEFRKKFPRYPFAPITVVLLLIQLLQFLGLMPSSLWVARPVRLATRAALILIATLIGGFSGVQLLRLALVSPERLQQQHDEFQRESAQRRRKRALKDRL